ncbi:MAG TPA: CotH kinase family protein [Bacteroidales bacterium]|nr:CotH kinase family protein [Bacteroidales bacterium]
MSCRNLLFTVLPVFLFLELNAQVFINEGSNRNYSLIADENGEFPDWVELYNAGNETISLYNYSLSDNIDEPGKWTFPNVDIGPGEYRVVFCSGKDRKPVTGFVNVVHTGPFVAQTGWNIHTFNTPFYWDGISNILVNTCSYSSTGYTTNSVFNQTPTTYWSTVFNNQDGSDASCYAAYGGRVSQRPNMKLNGHAVGTGQVQNSPYDYPAPYGNWYWGARHQMLIRASELQAAGLPVGNITSLGFDVVSTDPNTTYDYIDISLKLVTVSEITQEFTPVDTNNFLHTNFKLKKNGETVYLFSPGHTLLGSLSIGCGDLDNSLGRQPDAGSETYLFQAGTPGASNNASATFTDYLEPPSFSIPSGFFNQPFSVSITNPNPGQTSVHYTIDGSEPNILSPLYTGQPIEVMYSIVLKAKAFGWGILPSRNTVASYLFGVNHTTPVISVVTDDDNLYGERGIFDNWWTDWERTAYVEYFDSLQNLIFSQRTGMQIDGGWGGARYQPQHSFRLELDDGVLGDGPVEYPIIPDRPERNKYGQIYLRNGSNQYLVLPYKDACQVTAMGTGTYNYYSAWRPVSVYMNGYYFGLYELREKIDAEYFEVYDDADNDEMDLLSLSAWYGFAFRALEGSVDNFFEDYYYFSLLEPSDTGYWKQADNYFDLKYYTDYIIGESWMANNDWPGNNIKIYRSDKTNYRWRFCLIDLELGMAPNSWTDCYTDHIRYMLDQDPNNPFINIWKRSIENEQYRHYFINRFADVMNTAYLAENIISLENRMFDQVVGEMPKEYARWGDANHIPEQMLTFTENHNIFVSQLAERSTQVRNHIQSNFQLPNQVLVTLGVYPEGAGKINISTIAPDEYPWQGVYFNGVPVRIEALANQGYEFIEWDNNLLLNDTLNPVFQGMLDAESVSFNAIFEEISIGVASPDNQTLIRVYPNPAMDFIHILNNGNTKGAYYQLINANGQTILEGKLNGDETTLDIRHLTGAVYLLIIVDSDLNRISFRIVKI